MRLAVASRSARPGRRARPRCGARRRRARAGRRRRGSPSRAHSRCEHLGRRARDLLGERQRLLERCRTCSPGIAHSGRTSSSAPGRRGLLEARRGRPRGSAPSRRASARSAPRRRASGATLLPLRRRCAGSASTTTSSARTRTWSRTRSRRRRTQARSRSNGCRSSCGRRRGRLLEPRGDHLRVDWTQNVYRARARARESRSTCRATSRARRCPSPPVCGRPSEGRLREFKHALYEAFFCEGEDIATDARDRARGRRGPGSTRTAAVAAAYSAERFARIREIRARGRGGGSPRRAVAARRGRRDALGHGRARAAARGRAAHPAHELSERRAALAGQPISSTSNLCTSGSRPTLRISSVPRGTGSSAR